MRHHIGSIEVICGPMFSGKTEELIRRVRRTKHAQLEAQMFKSTLDNRYGEGQVNSHSEDFYPCTEVGSPLEIRMNLNPDTRVVGVDEVQFFDNSIVEVCHTLAKSGLRVILAGLDANFRAEPFGPMPLLIAEADEVTKLRAYCTLCGELASFTQRLVDEKPANYHDDLILVGAQESYQARCRHCHEVPGRFVKRTRGPRLARESRGLDR